MGKIKVSYSGGKFICACDFNSRMIPKEAKFSWNQDQKHWYTQNLGVAARLFEYCDETAKKQIAKTQIRISEWTGGLSISEGLTLFEFQKEAAAFALSRNRSYLALDPGLGKTPIAAVVAQTLHSRIGKSIYLCPPFLTRNVEAEFKKWAPQLNVSRYGSQNYFTDDVIVVPDSLVGRDRLRGDIVLFTKQEQAILFVDEAHRFKNDAAKRTQSLFGSKNNQGLADLFQKIIYLSGTPMVNRPIELFSVLNHSAPETINYRNKFEYGARYCDLHQNEWGWDFSGASNLDELRENVVGKFMLRFRKQDVMKELPPKLEEMVLLDSDLPPKLAGLDQALLKNHSPMDLMEGKIRLDLDVDTLHLATYRKELGLAKVEEAGAYIKYLLDETDESLLVFAIHKEVIAHLTTILKEHDPIVVTGSTPMQERHELVTTFQTNPAKRIFIGNIQAAGVGLTLTKATRVVFAEFSWVPGENDQASDRAHRIGQTDTVFVQYLVFKNSIDRTVLETVLRKRKVVGKI